MSWPMQVMHLLRKELMHTRYAVAVYLLVIVLRVAHAYGVVGMPGVFDVLLLLMVLFAMALVAFVVQSDSPVRSDAFWPSRPLSPSAVFCSKVLTAVLFLAVAFAAQVAGLMAFDTSIGRYMPDALDGLALFAMWLAIALVLAAVTKNIPNFVIALVALCIWTMVLVNLSLMQRWQVPPGVRVALMIIAVGAVGGLLVELYARRDPRIARAIGGVLALVAGLYGLRSRDVIRSELSYDTPVDGITMRVDVGDSATLNSYGDLNVKFSGTSRDTSLRLAILNAVASVRTADGATFDVPFLAYQGMGQVTATSADVGSSTVMMTGGVQSIPVPVSSNGGVTTTSLRLSPEQQRHVATGVKQLRLRGALLVQHPSLLTTVPLAHGAIAKGRGHRVRVSSLTDRAWPNAVTLRTERVRVSQELDGGEAWAQMIGVAPLDVVVVDKDGKPLYSLQRRNQHASNGWIVLPGQTVRTDSSIYLIPTPNRAAPSASLDSLGRTGASLQIFEWTRRSTFPVDVSGPLR